jgi:iron complex transport system ATP-binding protein
VAVVGPNGAGKSTLLQALAGLLPADGKVFWQGEELTRIPILDRGRRLAWVPQDFHAEFAFSVRDVVAQGRFAHGDQEHGVDLVLSKMDLSTLSDRPVTRLSGGERQRVLLGRALATEAPLQLWDEPLAQLDVRHALEVLSLARAQAEAGTTLVMTLHDLRLAERMDLVVVLDQGRLCGVGPAADVLTPEVLLEVFRVKARVLPGLTLEIP